MVKKVSKKESKRIENAERVVANPVAHAVQRLYSRSAPLLIVEALLFAAIGVLMLVRPVGLLTVMTFVIGGLLVLFGLYRTVAGFVASRGFGGGWLDVLFGLVNIVIGILFCVYPMGSIISVVYVFVILFLFKALRAMAFAINMARAKFGHYVLNLVMSIILVGLAVLLMFFPMAGAVAVVIYMALMMLMYAMFDFYMYLELRRLKKLVAE